jgi:hypothetical protein
MIKKSFMMLSTFLLAFGVLVGCNTNLDDQDYNNDNNLEDVRNPGLNDVTPRDVDFNGNNRMDNVGDEFEPDLDEEPSEQRNENLNNNDIRNIGDTDRLDRGRNNR